MVKRQILRFTNGKKEKFLDYLCKEIYLRIFVNNEEIAIVSIFPQDLEYFVYGFLFTSNLIDRAEDIKKLKISKNICYVEVLNEKFENFKFYNKKIDSGCGNPYLSILPSDKIETDIKIEGEKIVSIISEFQKKSEIFKLTGFVHSCCLSDGEKILFLFDDIGRHNAFDKLIGYSICKKIQLIDKIIITSGRITSDIVLKCSKAKIPVLISISGISDFALKIAKSYGITLCGFARGKRFNIYSFEERIIW